MSLNEVVDTAGRVNQGLASLAAARGLQFVQMRREWYGVDPIHIRPGLWRPAWQEILGCGMGHEIGERSKIGAWPEGLSLYLMQPERQWLFGVERSSRHTGVALSRGGRVWLF